VRPRRLLVLPALGLLASPLFAGIGSAAPGGHAATAPAAPVFRQYHAPASPKDARGRPTGGDSAGEPSLGYFPKTDDVLFMANKNTYRVPASTSARTTRPPGRTRPTRSRGRRPRTRSCSPTR